MRVIRIWRLFAVICLVGLATSTAFGQDTAQSTWWRHSLGLSIGTMHVANHDNVGSPLIYKGGSYPLGGAYLYDGEKNQQQLTLSAVASPINASPLMTDVSTDQYPKKAYFTILQLRYEYVHDLMPLAGGFLTLRVGGALNNELFARVYRYWGTSLVSPEGSGSGEAASTLEAVAELSHAFGERQVARLAIGVPLAGLVIRPPYSLFATGSDPVGWALDQSRFRTVGEFAGYEMSVSYTYPLSGSFDLAVRAHSEYYYYPDDLWHSATLLNGVSLLLSVRL